MMGDGIDKKDEPSESSHPPYAGYVPTYFWDVLLTCTLKSNVQKGHVGGLPMGEPDGLAQ